MTAGFTKEERQVYYEWMKDERLWTEKWGDHCSSQLVFIGVDLNVQDIYMRHSMVHSIDRRRK